MTNPIEKLINLTYRIALPLSLCHCHSKGTVNSMVQFTVESGLRRSKSKYLFFHNRPKLQALIKKLASHRPKLRTLLKIYRHVWKAVFSRSVLAIFIILFPYIYFAL